MISALILSLSASPALGARDRVKKVDVAAALTLGLPSEHAALASCGCAELTWAGSPSQRLTLTADDVLSVHHVVGARGMDTLVLRTLQGQDLTLEQAPCRFIAQHAASYGHVLGTVAEGVDASGAPTPASCSAPGQMAVDWVDELASRMVVEVADSVDVPLARVIVTTPDAEHEPFVETAKRDLSKLQPLLGHCFERGGDVAGPEAVVRATLSGGSVIGVAIVGDGTGAPTVDACLVAAVERAEVSAAPAGLVRLNLDVRHVQ